MAMVDKNKLLTYVIAIVVFQIVALLLSWLFFKEPISFDTSIGGAVGAVFFGYKGKKTKKKAVN